MGVHHGFFSLISDDGGVQSEYIGIPISKDYCTLTVSMYPSAAMEKQFTSYNPVIIAVGAALIFVFTSLVFLIYDSKVEQRQRNLMITAVRSTAVLSSLFPTAVRDKLLSQDLVSKGSTEAGRSKTKHQTSPKTPVGSNRHPMGLGMLLDTVNDNRNNTGCHLKPIGHSTHPMGLGTLFEIVDVNTNNTVVTNSAPTYSKLIKQKFASPIADLYPHTTVFFADICGFTAWSSSRGPDDVFILLESLYCEFDMIAQRREIFKVETIGDSYVAVAGLPEPMSHHATTMSKFAEDILQKMKVVVNELTTCFGPDTADLTLRIGLNSGPTTAGVIRGEKSRFQLFGDTVNTAARMESTGMPGKIQCTPKTAELIRKSGKGHWLQERHDAVLVKGKGEMTTFWIQVQKPSSHPTTPAQIPCKNGDIQSSMDCGTRDQSLLNVSCKRLVEWNLDLLQNMILDLLLFRQSDDAFKQANPIETVYEISTRSTREANCNEESLIVRRVPIDEVVEVLNLPETTWDRQLSQHISSGAYLDAKVIQQLKKFISEIASMYNSNPFHNFEHASHVVMSTKSLLDCVDKPSSDKNSTRLSLDPLVRLAIVFGALVHDVDHLGVPNSQLIKERTSVATLYKDTVSEAR
jgi:class 3 adenylate cyclase